MAKKNTGVSHLHALSRDWLFLPKDRATTRAPSQMSIASEQPLSVPVHLRQQSTPVLLDDWTPPLLPKTDTFLTTRRETPSPLPWIHSDPPIPAKFPLTLRIRREKEARRHGFKPVSSPKASSKPSPKPKYHSPWYLPPALWKTTSDQTRSSQTLHKSQTPYYHLQEKSPQFAENVKQLQKMPMMGRFKGHLETMNLRIPPCLHAVCTENEDKIGIFAFHGNRERGNRL